MKKVAIVQSNYIPWVGYFDLINSVDEFILFDDVQYTKRDWRNKNYIKSPNGKLRLSVPVLTKGRYHQNINQVEIVGNDWQKEHLDSIKFNYKKAKFFGENIEWIEKLYLEKKYIMLSEMNHAFLDRVCKKLNINTKLAKSSDYEIVNGRNERLIHLCNQTNARTYYSGKAAKFYIEESLFQKNNIKLVWFSYRKYPIYGQLWGEHAESLSIIDVIMNLGLEKTKEYING